MARLIDAMKTVTNLSWRITPLIKIGANPMRVYQEVLQVIAEAPTVDAVEVVRCWECKFGVTPYGDEHDGWIECSNIHSRPLFGRNDFCSFGERKDGDKDYGKAD